MRLALQLVVLVFAMVAAFPADAFETFLGRYVGAAELIELADEQIQERDVTTTVRAWGEGGFEIIWTSVIRVDGRRDVPGVRQVSRRMAFAPADHGDFFVEADDYNPFKIREARKPMAGDAIAWASVDTGSLDIWIAALEEGGEVELQHHRRVLTETGMQLIYKAYLAGALAAKGEGRMVRVD